jgi:hypothetical protein
MSRDTYSDENCCRCGTSICLNLVSQMSKFQPLDLLNGNDFGTSSCQWMVHLSLFRRFGREREKELREGARSKSGVAFLIKYLSIWSHRNVINDTKSIPSLRRRSLRVVREAAGDYRPGWKWYARKIGRNFGDEDQVRVMFLMVRLEILIEEK